LALRNNNEIMNSFLNCEGALNILREFFHDNPSKNHLVCGFYARIVQRSFHVSPEKTFEALSSCDFISDCAANLRMGAISDLLQNIVWIQGVDDDFLKIKQWYVSHGLCSKLVDLLDPNQAACVHENVMELYCNLVRNTRSQMYALEMKSDILNDELQSEILVGKLLDKMLMRHKNGTVFSSVTRNVCEILISLLSSNNILYRPSHTLYKDYNAEFSWVGGNPSSVSNGNISDVSNETDATVWCSDSERVVEKMVASRVSEFLDLVVEELESDTNPTDENWSYLLRVLIELCDTNHMETHILLEGQFKKCATGKLFSMVWRHPRSSILHSLLQRIIFFILYSSMESLSPLITYLFKPSCALPKLDLQSLRTYHIHLALAIEQARKSSPNSQGIEELVQEFPFWSEIMTNIEEWVSSNLPDPAVVNLRPSNQRACVDDVMDDFERQALAPHHTALLEFKNESVSSSMTDVFDTPLGELQTSSETKGFYVHGIRVCNVEVNLEENDVDESKFEAVCAMKECPILNDWPMQHGDQSFKWYSSFADDWLGLRKLNGGIADDCHAVAKERQHEDATTFQGLMIGLVFLKAPALQKRTILMMNGLIFHLCEHPSLPMIVLIGQVSKGRRYTFL
uniref:RNA polymerase I-specific transcription initiation factor RRN3 n=1 Tax=Angiostrongylus cantonensis TaxID=6313 RepID=A0A0K0DG05_ANGCA